MSELRTAFVDIVIEILAESVPGGRFARSAAKGAVKSVLSREEQDVIGRVADRVIGELYESEDRDAENPGAAKSAAYDVLDTLRKARLTPQTLVDCCLDADQLYKHLRRYPATGIDQASSVRKRLYDNAIHVFCAEVMASAPQIKSFEVFVYRSILKNQQKMLKLLEEQRTAAQSAE